MSTETATASEQQAVESSTSSSLLDQAIQATRGTERSRSEILLAALAEEALAGTVTWDRNLTQTINKAIALIDEKISKQLAVILHDEEVSKIEGAWRGLHYLVANTSCSNVMKIKVLNVTKNELFKDLDKALEFDQSQFFKKLYEHEFGTPGGEPYGALLGDYYFNHKADDVALLTKISGVCAAAFAPFVAAADYSLMGFDSWEELSNPRDLSKIFDSVEYIKWRGYRETEDSRFVTLAMPRVLSRLPYGKETKAVEEFAFEEVASYEDGKAKKVDHKNYVWMNAAYVLGARMTEAFLKYGWCTAIRGAEGGGKVFDLPAHIFKTDEGDLDIKCPTEVAITDRREAELSAMGLLPLCHYKNTDYSVFFGAQTTQKPKVYDLDSATSNAAISARLPYLMVVSRITHHLKIMARDKIGSMMELEDAQAWLNRWIGNYVNANKQSGPELRYAYPLADALIKVEAVPGKPGSYHAIAWLRPWLQMEELTTSMRLVANIPSGG